MEIPIALMSGLSRGAFLSGLYAIFSMVTVRRAEDMTIQKSGLRQGKIMDVSR
jgi:hypothetical protein